MYYFNWAITKHLGFKFFRVGVLQESLIKLVEACSDQSHNMDRWLSKLEASGWQSHVKEILTTACLAAQCIDRQEGFALSLTPCSYQPAANDHLSICLSQGGGVGASSRHRGNRLNPAGHIPGSDHPRSHLQDHQRLPGSGGARVAAGKTALTVRILMFNFLYWLVFITMHCFLQSTNHLIILSANQEQTLQLSLN